MITNAHPIQVLEVTIGETKFLRVSPTLWIELDNDGDYTYANESSDFELLEQEYVKFLAK